jgi:hypothetical protein
MRRPILIATFVFALVVVPALAQRGGVHGGFAGHGGFGGRVGGAAWNGGFRGGPSFHNPGFRSSGFRNQGLRNPGLRNNLNFGRRGSDHDPFLHNRGFQSKRFHRFDHGRDDFRFRFGFRNCFGFNCGWGWPWWWGWGPGWWDSDSSYDQNQERDLEPANEMNLQSLGEQGQRRQEDPVSNVQSGPQPQPREAVQTAPSTVLIFRDQHRQEIQNYAILGTTLWAFAPQRTQRISLADLDIPATTKANDNRGLDFRVPGDEAQ